MKYDRTYLLSELNRFIAENERMPLASDMKVKFNYPPISAYREVFGSFTNALIEFESYDEIDTAPMICVDQLAKYTEICQNRIYELALEFPHVSMNDITKLFWAGYLIGADAGIEMVAVEVLQEEFL